MTRSSSSPDRLVIRLATEADRAIIYRLRHAVYAEELGQHARNTQERLTDALDTLNLYFVAVLADEIAGFISVTPPSGGRYSIDKYVDRGELPFPCNDGLYEVRLLTVPVRYRVGALGGEITALLLYAAFRWVEGQGGSRIVAIGRREVLTIYTGIGLQPLGRSVHSGAVTFELLTATIAELRTQLKRHAVALRHMEPRIDWRLGVPYDPTPACLHGGAVFEGVSETFDRLDTIGTFINADVLDAWFPPAPGVLTALHEHLPWLLGTSPPVHTTGLTRTVAEVRGVGPENILAGGGSSALIYLALGHWVQPRSRVLLLDPTYGEYAHVLEHVIGCPVDRLHLDREGGYVLDPERLVKVCGLPYDLVVLVNPNSPTGRHVCRQALIETLKQLPLHTRVWIDEAYVEYAGHDQSLEEFAAGSANVIVCKSMSKVYALSGARAAYLCGPGELIEELRPLQPPYAVSLLAQVAAVAALRDPEYYAMRWAETRTLQADLVKKLRALGPIEIVPGVANFLLCHLPLNGPDSSTVVARCREQGLYVRNARGMGSQLGSHSLRVAVKDAMTNERMVAILGRAINQ